jgi:hypothetical protein
VDSYGRNNPFKICKSVMTYTIFWKGIFSGETHEVVKKTKRLLLQYLQKKWMKVNGTAGSRVFKISFSFNVFSELRAGNASKGI